MSIDNKNKIFKAEDFDKVKPLPKKPRWPWALGVVLVCGGLTFFLTRGNSTNSGEVVETVVSDVENDIVQDNPTVDTQDVLTDTFKLAEQGYTDQKETLEKGCKELEVPNHGQGTNRTNHESQSNSTTCNNNSSFADGSVEEEAWRTIRGDYGNGEERKVALGSRYNEIQSRVNAIYRERNLQ